ncbi:2-amino-4-hydroxy-6-hydroxymethyldihydropteridine diphosphokinase [Antricoccus suffuscus]|uniref:2-amino-4-hydroxy-6-hydroxymethyldihydropteridine diphosphokinase n=1 Tax=Antricoccus suffuscus TaxID=1629062 RepID=A0A2T1A3V8_9ACTN|nr:2-amino-4-hydroxy-6-hydroxymethyldihydropteridine diphosphokinase [Antricoccus suffuscus]PRZ43167.1 2-amino-4-hydroxy-6-hydroxymethyldihydropteridine diphosphokinase [Antricoccus suffuscus]
MTRAVLSIGSNIGDTIGHLQSVLTAAGSAVRAVSSVYETAPWGGVQQDPFHNAVLIVDDPARDAWRWLEFAHSCEDRARRTREVRWGPRTLDVDIVAVYDGPASVTSADPTLTLPHPRAHQRAFVLVPWAEIEPAARLPQGPVAELVGALDLADPEQRVVRRSDIHLEVRGGA